MKSKFAIIWEFIKISLPLSLSSMIYFFQVTITLYYIRLKGTQYEMSAVGLANMIVATFGTTVLQGINGGLETLVSQANGSGNQYMCGVYLKTARVIAIITFLPISYILYNIRQVLKAF